MQVRVVTAAITFKLYTNSFGSEDCDDYFHADFADFADLIFEWSTVSCHESYTP